MFDYLPELVPSLSIRFDDFLVGLREEETTRGTENKVLLIHMYGLETGTPVHTAVTPALW